MSEVSEKLKFIIRGQTDKDSTSESTLKGDLGMDESDIFGLINEVADYIEGKLKEAITYGLE